MAADLASSKTATTMSTANKAVTISKVSAAPKPPPALTITPNPKPNTSETASNSLLKSNVTQIPKNRGYTVTTEPINGEKLDAIKANSAAVNNIGNTSTPKNKNPGLPPELICISTPSNEKHPAAVPPPSYQLQMQLTLQQQIQQQHQNSLLLSQQTKQLLQNIIPPAMVPNAASNPITSPKKQTSTNSNSTNSNANANANATTNTNTNKSPNNNQNNSAASKANAIRLPDTLTEAERRESKNWRPTLMPVTMEKNSNDTQLYQTADGRRLPYLVQVQSGGKPYMISIYDYNRMCILRRERLLKDHPEVLKNKSPPSHSASAKHNSSATAAAAAAAAPLSNSTINNVNAKPATTVDLDKLSKPPANPNNSNNGPISNRVQVPNKILEQNSLIPINSKTNENSHSDSLLRFRFPKSKSSLLKSNAVAASQPKSVAQQQIIPPNPSVTATVMAPTIPLMPKLPIPLTNALIQSNVVSITSTPSIAAILAMTQASTTTPPIQIIPNQTPPITITNVSSGSANNTNQSNVSSLEALFRTTNQVTTTPSTMWQWAEQLNKSNSITPIDTSASSILSKIPKSLTVIPQQKSISKGIDE